MHFWYDGQGRPAIVNYNGTIYHYVYNLQGDVIALLDNSNSIVVEYKYDAWGYLLGKTGTLSGTLGELNPFRYRGYVYDEETGLYYLRSRYYNPVWGRFISADALLGKTGALLGDVGLTFGHNLFVYCGNNPIIYDDQEGAFWNLVIGAVVGAVVGAAVGAVASAAHWPRKGSRCGWSCCWCSFGYRDWLSCWQSFYSCNNSNCYYGRRNWRENVLSCNF